MTLLTLFYKDIITHQYLFYFHYYNFILFTLFFLSFFIEKAVPQFFIKSNLATLDRDDTLNIECVADLHIYRNIVLKKDGVNLPVNPVEVNETSRVITLEKQATLEDSGLYSCVGTLRRGGQNIRELTLTVKGIVKHFSCWFFFMWIF